MKRKVIQLAGKTSVISLPNKWIRRFNIKKGDELDLEELGNNILIKIIKNETEVRNISFNIDNFNERTLRYAASALHKLGYDEITFYYNKPKLNDVIQDLIKNLLLGFVVIEQTGKKVVLKNISNEVDSEFNSTLRRAFLVTISLSNSSLEAIEAGQFENLLSLINLEMSNNQLTSFCIRLINKGFYRELDKQQFITTIIWNLEKICDEYKAICVQLSKNTNKIPMEILDLYKEVNKFFYSYYELIYKFSVDNLNNLVSVKEAIINNLNILVPKTRYELQLLNILWSILSKTSDMSSSIFALHHLEFINPL
ncbi:phosphate uptake regulator PhoU [Candidatus Woesearchaeota archaeon]|nr:phosphate uptake regulator PhoU [Candidatus Woesearchaeota archaeon]